MLAFASILKNEERGLKQSGLDTTKAPVRVAILFLLVVLGILANWFWGIGWEFLRDPSKGLRTGPGLAIVVRVVLSFVAGLLTFVPTYNKVRHSTQESWVPNVLAFQNGFFWQAALDAVTRQFHGGAGQ